MSKEFEKDELTFQLESMKISNNGILFIDCFGMPFKDLTLSAIEKEMVKKI